LQMRIHSMRVNHLTNPRGFCTERPVFSWITDEVKGKRQIAARVVVARDCGFQSIIYDSGMSGEISSLGFAPVFSVKPCQIYYWKVTVETDVGEVGESPISCFETGRMGLPWAAQWITAPFDKEIHPLFQKNLVIDSEVESARAYVTGLGLFELYINGEKVEEEYLTPFATDYKNWVQYMTYDITDCLHPGENAVGSMLGNGWYKGRFGFVEGMRELYGSRFLFLCQIEVKYRDGRTLTVGTDSTWKCAPAPVLQSSLYDGETYDANREIPGFSTCRCDLGGLANAVTAGIPGGEVRCRMSLPVVISQRRKPIRVIRTPAGETVLDFGQVMTGWVEADCQLPSGGELILEYGELLQEGNFYHKNLRTARQRYCFVSDGKHRRVRPHFTYYGFRYVRVTGMVDVDPNSFTACVMYSQLEEMGEIQTSNEDLNRLVENTKWGLRGNFLDVPTDCPQRDERMGWTGDAQVFCATASFHMYTPAFYRKYLYDMLLEQKSLGGSVPFVVPDVLGQIWDRQTPRNRDTVRQAFIWGDEAHGSCAWGEAATVIPWSLYLFYGDRCLLEEEYRNMKAWVEFISNREGEIPGEGAWTAGFHFADWLALDNPDPESAFGGTETRYVALACYYYSAELTEKAARVLKKKEDAKRYGSLKKRIREKLQRDYFAEDGSLKADTQTGLVLALKYGFAPEQSRCTLVDRLREKLEERDIHLDTGFVGTPILCPVLSENGCGSYAYTLLLNEDYPSWLYEVKMGATTVWERWNSLLSDGRISDTGMNSMNHYAYGSVAEWMYRFMCGINPTEEAPGFKAARLTPMPDTRLRWAKARYLSASGEYGCGWERAEGGILYRIRIPFDCSAKFILSEPASRVFVDGKADEIFREQGEKIFEAGDYEIFVKDKEGVTDVPDIGRGNHCGEGRVV
jgi:alpha-L-rhamnosidase